MNDDDNQDDTAPAPVVTEPTPDADETPAADNSGRTFSQDEVSRLIARESAKARERGRKDAEAATVPAQKTNQAKDANTSAPDQVADALAQLNELRDDLSFDRETKDLELSDVSRGLLRKLYGTDDYGKLLGELKPDAPAPAAVTYKSPGAVVSAQADVREMDATKWTRDAVNRMKSDGVFLDRLNQYRDSLPGGGDGIFRRKIPKAR